MSVEDIARAAASSSKFFKSVVNSDKLAILERWTDQKALDPHTRLAPPPFRPELRTGNTEREDNAYNRPGNPNSRTLNFKL
jgi:hypothetical protein